MARQMKESGIEWIGMIPADWNIVRIGTQYTERKTKVSDTEYPPLSVTMKGIVPQLATAAKTDAHDDRKMVCKGDFAINSRSDRRGSCGISAYDGSVSLINTILCPRDEMNPEYYDWLFHSSMFSDEFYKWGHGIVDDLWTTNWQDMKRIFIPEPALEEQARIAEYLNKMCAEIDAVISKTKATIEEYKKLKQSIITNAVTKGLRDNRQMRKSGIEWIGDIPSDWMFLFLKYVTNFQEGPGIMGNDFRNEGIPLIRISGMKGNYVTRDGCNFLEQEMVEKKWKHFKLLKDDVVISASASMGIAALVDEEAEGCIPYTGLIRFPISDKLDKLFLRYYLISNEYMEQINVQKTGTAIQHYGPTHIEKVKIALPPLDEQREIADYLDKKCAEIDTLIEKKIALLAEMEAYKKSVIYEYVTGKKEVL
ncbi:MAG: restriction endonuclease subunit S [Firmicutes bacterium]|nr:restriction endonuclease subunit S [Bacillota bacterium]